ncbi:hypothetical protein BD769DRAFT_1663822 [Suillus cothurnatus]|nr:hypothetical protein BD769DRAFT_1663822 [Suillus cothurnatus]
MSTPVDTSLAGLKEITAQIVGIISGGRQIPAGNAHMALTSQVTDLVAQVVWDYGKGPHISSIMLSCSKELMRVRAMSPWVWPNWHSIGFDDLCLMKHAWCTKILTWEALGDHSFDLPVAVPPSVGPIPVDLPSPPIVTDNAASSSTNMTTKSWAMVKDKGKGKADLELEVDGSRKRKSPMMSALPSQPLKSAMKGQKRVRSAHIAKSRMVVESEDDEDPVIQPSGSGVPEVVLPLLSTIDSRTPGSPRSPRSPKKQTFGLVSAPKRGCSKTITAVKAPAPAPAPIPSSSSAVPHAALDLPMPDIHAMALAIRDGTARIAILEAHVVEQDGKIDTLQCLHESLRHEIIDQHPSFPLPDLPSNATLLLDQSIPTAMSPPASALPALIDLSMTGMEPTPPTFQDASSIEGLIFEPTEGQPEDPQTSGNMVDPGDPGNLVPEYNSDDMDVEVKVEEDVDIAT